jgi:hypothetical protein
MHVASLHFVAWLKPRNYVSWSHSVYELACWIRLLFCSLAQDVTSCPSSKVSEQRRNLKASLLAVFKGLPFSPRNCWRFLVSNTSLSTLYTIERRKQKCSIDVAFYEVRNTGNVCLPCMVALYLLNFSSWSGLQVTYSTIWFSAQCSVAFLYLCTTSLLRPAHTKIALVLAFNHSIKAHSVVSFGLEWISSLLFYKKTCH